MRELKDDDGNPACFRAGGILRRGRGDLKKAHEELMRNVVAINSEGLAGQVIPVSRKAFQIGDAGNADVVVGIDFKPAEAAGYHRYVQDGGGLLGAAFGIRFSP